MKRKHPKVEPIRDPTLFQLERAFEAAAMLKVDRPFCEPGILLGTSAFTAAGWEGSFYPRGMQPRDFLSYYSTQFATVEVDSTFYRTPSVSTVTGWYEKTPPDFVLAAKVPQVITHEKMLLDCEAEFDEFIGRMDLLDDKLGPLLLQFPYFNKYAFKSVGEFLARLRFFLKRLQGMFTCRFAVEIRNENWLDARFADLLREHNVALVLIDRSWMPRPLELFEKFDPITADFAYVRWLGDRKGIEQQTKVWDKVIVDRTSELGEWVEVFRKFVARNIKIFALRQQPLCGPRPGDRAALPKTVGESVESPPIVHCGVCGDCVLRAAVQEMNQRSRAFTSFRPEVACPSSRIGTGPRGTRGRSGRAAPSELRTPRSGTVPALPIPAARLIPEARSALLPRSTRS